MTPRTRLIALPLVGVLVFGAGQLTGRSAAAENDGTVKDPSPTTCSTEMLKGRYILSGSGTLGGDFDVIINLVMDGKGTITEGFGTVVTHSIAAVENIKTNDGTYSVDANCTGKLTFFAKHKTLGPYDHIHQTEIMVFDSGRQFALLNLSTELPGAPNGMTEAFLLKAHRV
jgi:hypothetical protein